MGISSPLNSLLFLMLPGGREGAAPPAGRACFRMQPDKRAAAGPKRRISKRRIWNLKTPNLFRRQAEAGPGQSLAKPHAAASSFCV